MILFKHFKNSISTSLILSKLNNNRFRFLDFLRIFIIRFFFSIPSIRNLIKIKNIKEEILINNKEFVNKNFKLKDILKEIEINGYFDKLILRKDIIEKIKANINDQNCFLDSFSKDLNYKEKNYKKIEFKNLDELASISISKEIKHLIVKFKQKNNHIFYNNLISESFLNIAKGYLNKNNLTCKIECYISNPFKTDQEEMKKHAQFYHYDCDFKKFLKIFIYLNDVDIKSGPHAYIQKTHKKKFFKHILAERINDEEAIKYYGNENKKIFTKDEGSVIIEDTFGLHKGEVPKLRSRYVLIIKYGVGKSILKNDPYFYI